jgi:hypothetical protein
VKTPGSQIEPETSWIEPEAATSSQPYVAREMADCSIWLDNLLRHVEPDKLFVELYRALCTSTARPFPPLSAASRHFPVLPVPIPLRPAARAARLGSILYVAGSL